MYVGVGSSSTSSSASDVPLNSNGGEYIIRSSTLRGLLILASICLFLYSSSANGSDPASAPIVDMQRKLIDTEVELAWDEQHVHELEEKELAMLKSFAEEHKVKQYAIQNYSRDMHDIVMKNDELEHRLKGELKENEKLKATLRAALEDLAKARSGGIETTERNLRGRTNPDALRPGDSVEIIQDEEGKTSLLPGLIADISVKDGITTYLVVNVDMGLKINLSPNQFRPYQTSPKGTQAYYHAATDVFVPVTIVDYIRRNHKDSNGINGQYMVTFDGESPERVELVPAMRVHRYLEVEDEF